MSCVHEGDPCRLEPRRLWGFLWASTGLSLLFDDQERPWSQPIAGEVGREVP